eukprot:PhM_4_TR18673/c0_g1_i1/m.71141
MVDVVHVEVSDARLAREALELLDAANTDDLLPILAVPDRERRAPVAAARDSPVLGILKPVVEALRLHELWHPVALLRVLDELRLDGLDVDEPRRDGLVDERCLAAPTEGVRVDNRRLVQETAALFQLRKDLVVDLFHVLTRHVGHLAGVAPVLVDGADNFFLVNDIVLAADTEIVLTKAGRAVHDTRTGVRRDVAVNSNAESTALTPLLEVVEERHVLLALELLTLHLGEDDEVALLLLEARVQLANADLGDDVLALGGLVLDRDVVELGVDAENKVARERPRRRCPRDQVRRLVLDERERDQHGGVRDVLVVHVGLEVAQRRRAARAEGHHLEAAVDELLVPELLEDPPDGLHVREVHRLVVVLEVDPATEARHDLLPLTGVAHDNAAAVLVVLIDAELFDLHAGLDAELLLDLKLNREAVAVPAEATLNVMTLLVGVAAHNVLDRAGEDVAVMGRAGGERRTVVEGVAGSPLALLERRLEGVDLLPVCEDLVLELGEA